MYLVYNNEEKAKQNLDKVFSNMKITGDISHSQSWDVLKSDSSNNWYFTKPDKFNCKNFDSEKLMQDIEFDSEVELPQEEVI